MTQKWTHRYQIKAGRWVFAPTEEARRTGRRVKRAVASQWTPPPFYFHLRAGGHVAALRRHDSHNHFFRADLEDFFGQVNRSRVTRCLKEWFPYADAREMASESVVNRPGLNGFVLPYGFIQSPILASLALDRSKLGSYLRSLDASDKFIVSVYVDDLVISSDDDAALQTAAAMLEVKAKESRFPLNSSKTEGPAAAVTAFNIELSHKSMRIDAGRLAAFSAAYQAAASAFIKDGIVGYVASVNPVQVSSL